MLDTHALLLEYVNSLKACFYKDKSLIWRIIIFIFTWMCVLWAFMAQAVLLFILTFMQIPSEGIYSLAKDEKLNPLIRVVLLTIAYPIVFMCLVVLPFFQMFLWIMQFLFNCFAYLTSLGKSGWSKFTYK